MRAPAASFLKPVHFKTAIASSYKVGLKISLFTLPVFVPFALLAIKPYWPANLFGWLAIVVFIVFVEVGFFVFHVYIESRRTEPQGFSYTKILKLLTVVIPVALVLLVLVMKLIDYAKDHLFVVRP